jgi:hypothetical protein
LIAYALVLLPVFALVGAGYWARTKATAGRNVFGVIPLGATLYSSTLALLAWLGEARLGAGIVRNRGFAVIAADPAMVLLFGFGWALVAGVIGWKLAERKNREVPESQEVGMPGDAA